MYRLAYNELKKWKEKASRKPLVLRGARQVGKTWLLREFGENEYKQMVYLNLEKEPELQKIFELDLDPERIIRGIELLKNIKITPEDTLIIFDEIQSVPRALTSLKYFNEDAPEYQIAVAGSLLGIALHEGTSFPVGKVDFLDIYPMNFNEFVLAVGEEGVLRVIERDSEIDLEETKIIHDKTTDLLQLYMEIGGMPEAVKKYLDGGTFEEVRDIQKDIILAYESDFSKHAPKNEVPKIQAIYNAIPKCLSRENKKFVFGVIKESARAREYEYALTWCEDTGIIKRVKRINNIEIPIEAYSNDNIYKLFMSDIGLLGAKLDIDYKNIIDSKNDLFKTYKGAFIEQFVCQELVSIGIKPYYYSRDDSRGEIDFIIQKDNEIIPIEVKAGENLNSVSLNNFIEKWGVNKGVKFSALPYKKNEKIENIPLYLVERI